MSKKYGQLLTKHGKIIGKHGKQMKNLGEYLKDESVSDGNKLDFINKKANLLSVKIKKDQGDYISKVNKMDNQEILAPMHEKMLKVYEIMTDTFKEIQKIDSGNPEDYINAIENGNRRIDWFFN